MVNGDLHDQNGSLTAIDLSSRSLGSHVPPYAATPNNILPTCQLDTILYQFVAQARQRLAAGASVLEVLGPPQPDMTAFVYPDKADGPKGLTALMIDIVKAYSAISGMPEKACSLVHQYYYIRWYVSPTPEHFKCMREYMKPVEAQIRIPHPMWVDLVLWFVHPAL